MDVDMTMTSHIMSHMPFVFTWEEISLPPLVTIVTIHHHHCVGVLQCVTIYPSDHGFYHC